MQAAPSSEPGVQLLWQTLQTLQTFTSNQKRDSVLWNSVAVNLLLSILTYTIVLLLTYHSRARTDAKLIR